jgi:hypothetical protein
MRHVVSTLDPDRIHLFEDALPAILLRAQASDCRVLIADTTATATMYFHYNRLV